MSGWGHEGAEAVQLRLAIGISGPTASEWHGDWPTGLTFSSTAGCEGGSRGNDDYFEVGHHPVRWTHVDSVIGGWLERRGPSVVMLVRRAHGPRLRGCVDVGPV